MPIIRIIQPPEVTQEMYDAVNQKVGVDAEPPEGLIIHTAGDVDGTWQIVDVWESAEHAERFDRERLGPAINEVAGGANPGEPKRTVYEAHHIVRP